MWQWVALAAAQIVLPENAPRNATLAAAHIWATNPAAVSEQPAFDVGPTTTPIPIETYLNMFKNELQITECETCCKFQIDCNSNFTCAASPYVTFSVCLPVATALPSRCFTDQTNCALEFCAFGTAVAMVFLGFVFRDFMTSIIS